MAIKIKWDNQTNEQNLYDIMNTTNDVLRAQMFDSTSNILQMIFWSTAMIGIFILAEIRCWTNLETIMHATANVLPGHEKLVFGLMIVEFLGAVIIPFVCVKLVWRAASKNDLFYAYIRSLNPVCYAFKKDFQEKKACMRSNGKEVYGKFKYQELAAEEGLDADQIIDLDKRIIYTVIQ